jgi:hypothetical protein
MPVPVSQTPTLTSTLVPKEESNMPFIDDELFWYSDNDGKMDLTQCLQVIAIEIYIYIYIYIYGVLRVICKIICKM